MSAVEAVGVPYNDLELVGRLHQPAAPARSLVIISHGLLSSKDSVKLTHFAEALARDGHLALRFDHVGCGDSPGDIADTTLSGRRDEFLAAVQLMRGLGPHLPLVYMGSSFGGTVALLAADIEPPVCSLHWSTPWDYTALSRAVQESEEFPPLMALVRDLPSHDLEGLLGRSSRMYIVHGEEDELVPVVQAERGHELCLPPKGLLLLPGGDHRLTRLEDQRQAMAHSLAWIEQFVV